MKNTPQFEGLYNYRTWEDKIISIICARYWRPKRIGGSSIAKADVVIRTYFRIQLLCMMTFFTGLAGKTNSRFDLKININLLFCRNVLSRRTLPIACNSGTNINNHGNIYFL
jgi:hypothetical protein